MLLSAKPLRIFAQISAALGLLSISLTNEIAPPWLAAGWAAWTFSLMADGYPRFLAKLRSLETIAVAAMVAMLVIDFLIFHFSIFIAVTHFLLLFQIVKLAGEKTRKDCVQIFLFSFFQILASCTLSVDAWHAGILLGFIPTATAALFWNQITRETEQAGIPGDPATHKHYRWMATGICLTALPLNLVLTLAVFVLFPRLTLNASLPGFSGHRAGYTDQMNLAQKGRLQQDSSVVLWLSFPKPEDRSLWNGYLRGDVLSQFDGRQWRSPKDAGSRIITRDYNGIFLLKSLLKGAPLLRQTITLTDTSASTLFAISKPIRVVAPLPALQENEEGGLRWLVPWNRPLRYEVVSEIAPETDSRPADLLSPDVPLTRVRDLAGKIAGNKSPLEQALAIEKYLQTNFRYSTDFGDHVPENPVDNFLFERREGNCGHFASAMAVMLRLRGIPSRVVAGYLKGEWNEPAGAVVIRERDAHAWVEAYIEGRGWMTFDPTPLQTTGAPQERGWLRAIGDYWVYTDLLWNRFVIEYDLYSQIKAFETVKGASGRWGLSLAQRWMALQRWVRHGSQERASRVETESAATARFPLKEVGASLVLIIVTGFLLKRKRMSYDSTVQFYRQFLNQMDRAGYPKREWETGWEFAKRLEIGQPERAAAARDATARYYERRFRRV